MLRVRMLGLSMAAAALLLDMAMFSPAVSQASAFSDVQAGHGYASAIEELSSRGIIVGYTTGEFGIDDPASRQQFAKMIVKTLGLPVTGDESSPFTDVEVKIGTDPLYPSKYVAVCAKEGITSGKTATTFDPYAHITRQQLITMVARAMRFLDPPSDYSPPFAQEQFALKDHYEHARKAAYARLLDGLEGIGRAYDFQADATRGECAQLLHNLLPQEAVIPPNPEAIASAQERVDALKAMQPTSIPEHFMNGETARQAGDLDVNAYFKVLTHLRVEPGYVLDYVYDHGGIGGAPIIYARPEIQPAYASFAELVAALAAAYPDAGYRDGSKDFLAGLHAQDYLDHVQADSTPEGYLQLALLRLLGDQFYLYWHANYNDMAVVCDSEALDEALAKAVEFWHRGQPSVMWIRSQASAIDLRPTVHLLDDGTAAVRLVSFSKWGGLREMSCTLSQTPPHDFSDWESRTLVDYHCGVLY